MLTETSPSQVLRFKSDFRNDSVNTFFLVLSMLRRSTMAKTTPNTSDGKRPFWKL